MNIIGGFVMEWMYIVAGVVIALYVVLVLLFYIGWYRISPFVPLGKEKLDSMVSVVVACRNEEKHLRNLIACIAQQSNQNFELILVNDHSTDATRNYIKTAQQIYPKIQLVDSTGSGKKQALREGILKASGELILVTDADCMPSYHWIEAVACFQQKNPSDLIICPVKLSGAHNLFSYLQVLEFTSLVASAAGSAGAGMPILCNGANLAFRKEAWLQSANELHDEEPSGDDMFLLESIKRRKGKITFLKSESAFVTTRQSETLAELLKQRRRWSAKSRLYKDWHMITAAIVVFLTSLLILATAVMSVFSQLFLYVFAGLFLLKYLVDSLFLAKVRSFFQLENIWIFSLLLSLVYPVYIVVVAVSSLVYRPKSWK